MSAWRKEPPTYNEWLAANNHGHWWIKFLLVPARTEETEGKICYFGEAWYTEVVSLTCSHPDGKLFGGKGKLHASGSRLREFDLDNKEMLKDMYWQPVMPPLDDIKDKRPDDETS